MAVLEIVDQKDNEITVFAQRGMTKFNPQGIIIEIGPIAALDDTPIQLVLDSLDSKQLANFINTTFGK